MRTTHRTSIADFNKEIARRRALYANSEQYEWPLAERKHLRAYMYMASVERALWQAQQALGPHPEFDRAVKAMLAAFPKEAGE